MFSTIVRCAVFLLVFVCSVTSQDCSDLCNCQGPIPVDDTAQPGDVVKSFTDNAVVAVLSNCEGFYLNGSQLVLNRTLTNPCFVGENMQCHAQCSGTAHHVFFIQINRVDLHPPSFQDKEYNATVSEDAERGRLVILFSDDQHAATDRDCGHQNVNYALVQDAHGLFNMSGMLGNVRLQGALDYDVTSTYSLNVSAESNGKKAYVGLEIHVQDADTLPPKFVDAGYSLEIVEESTNTAWLNTTPPLLCIDQDTGINETTNYSFADGSNTTKYFSIDGSSGWLRQWKSIDSDTIDTLLLEIKCYQVDKPGLRTTDTTVTVTVVDVNDNPPVFSPANYSVQLTENYAGYVVTVSATDADQGENAKFTYELLSGGDKFDIDAESGIMTSKYPSQLDREDTDNVIVVVRAVDGFGNYSTNNAAVSIQLLDENDNNPKFSKLNYNLHFNDSTNGTYIDQINASDADEANTPNSNITYEIDTIISTGTISPHFPITVDTLTGVLTVSHAVEPQYVYTMLAKACDNPDNANERRCTMVLVTAVLTNNSTFTSEHIHVQVMERTSIDTMITPIPIQGDAYDTSVPEFAVDQYTTASANDMIVTAAELDRELTATYSFTITVTSIQYGVIGNVSVTLDVLDVNDNVPQFTADVFYFPLPDTKQASRTVGQLNSTDRDDAANGNITYTIHETMFYDLFTLDPLTGEVAVTDDWWELAQTFYQFTAIVSDHGTPSLSSMVTVYLMHFDVGDNFIRIPTPTSKTYIDDTVNTLEIELTAVLRYGQLNITLVEPASTDIPSIGSYITLQAAFTNGTLVPGETIRRDVAENWSRIQAIFLKHSSLYSTLTGNSGDLETAEIALIAVAAALFLGGCVAIAVVCRQWHYHIKQNQLFSHMKRRSNIYDSQELRMSFDDDEADSRASSVRQLTGPKRHGPPLEGSFDVNYINPMFTADEEITIKSVSQTDLNTTPRIPRWSTFDSIKDAMASLEDLTIRLNAEDSISRVTNMSRSRKSSAGVAQITLDPLSLPDTATGESDTGVAGYLVPPADYPGNANGMLPPVASDEVFLPERNSLYAERFHDVFDEHGQPTKNMNGDVNRDRLTEEATAF